MIHGGSQERTRVIGAGTFRCPREGANRRYELFSIRRWRTLGSIALFPTRDRMRFVECQTCHSTFDPRVIDQPHAYLEDVLTATLRRAAVTILGVERSIEADVHRAAVIVLQRHAATPYRHHDLDRDLAIEQAEPGKGLRELCSMSGRLNDRGRAALVDAAAQVASAGAAISVERIQALDQVALAVGVPIDRARAALRGSAGRAALAV